MFRVIAGPIANLVARAVASGDIVAISGAADASWPVSNLYDARSDIPFKWSAIPTNGTITIDINGPTNGDAESTDLSSWLLGTGAGTFARDTGTKNSGAASFKILTAGGGGGQQQHYTDYVAQAGELRTISWAIEGPGGGGAELARVYLQNRHTGNYLKNDGTWSATIVYLDTQHAAAFKTGSRSYQVESFLACGKANPTLRLFIDLDSGVSKSGFFDDLLDLPAVDYCGLHGAINLMPAVAQMRSSTDNFSGSDTLEGTLSAAGRPPVAFVLLATPIYRRYWRAKISGTPVSNPAIGEWFLGQTVALLTNPEYPVKITPLLPVSRQKTPGGMPFDYPLATYERRSILMPFTFTGDAAYQQQRDLFYGFCGGPLTPLVLLPIETDADVAIYGKWEETPIDFTRENSPQRKAEFTMTELPFPS